MKRIAAISLAAALLVGCAAPSMDDVTVLPAATAEAAGQSLTVYCDAPAQSALRAALQHYADAQAVEVTYTDDAATADLALLAARPEGEGWQDLAAQPLLAAAARRAGLPAEGQSTVAALPLGRSLYAYWADGSLLSALLGEDCLPDLQNATWAEWSGLAEDLTAWLAAPAETTLTLNGESYALPAQRPEAAANLQGVFALPSGEPAAAWGGTTLTGALLAAGDTRSADTLTGPLNGVYSALTLELANTAATGTLADAANALAGGQALFVRGSLADLAAALGADAVQNLVPVPFKCYFEQSDLTTEEYDLTGLMNYPTLACAGYLAIPAGSADPDAAAAAILWMYGSGAGDAALTDDLLLVTPWNTASDTTALGAMQVQIVSTGILPEEALTTAQANALAAACAALTADGGSTARSTFAQAVLAGLGAA